MAKLRVGLVGFGFILSRGHLPAYQRRAAAGKLEIAAVADISPARRSLARSLLPKARIYSDHEELLRVESGHLDFLDIATPPSSHGTIARAALESGVHVLCEKPLTTCPAEAAALLETARRCRRVIYPCHNYKHAPVVKAIKREISSGRLGAISGLTLNTFRNTHAKGAKEWETDWRRERRYSGGGIAMDHGSHTFYLTFDWFGEYPVSITAKTSNRSHDRWDTEDNFSAVLTFPSGLATVHLSWTAGVRKVIYTVQGERGGITVNDDAFERGLIQPMEGGSGQAGAFTWRDEARRIGSGWMDASHVQWFDSLLDQFLQSIRDGRYVPADALDALRCVQIIATAYQSAAEGCRELPLALNDPWN